MQCLSETALAEYVGGRVSGAAAAEIRAHLEECADCRRRVEVDLKTSDVVLQRAAPGPAIRPGARLGRYEVVARIGAGGMGEVHRARDALIGREVAVKVISGAPAVTPELLRRFELEARAVGALNHPNVLTIYDVGGQDGTPYLVTELLEGETLRALLRRGGLSEKRAVDLALQICRGLGAAHDKGIVHRDLKPENLFLLKDGRLKILDFGLAKLVGPAGAGGADQTAAVVGTAGYLAPEALRGEAADHRADLFAVGAILYEMLTGRRAFQGPSAVEAHHAALSETPSMAEVSAPLARVVERCLEKAPEDRFQTASDLAFALAWLVEAHEIVSSTSATRPAAPPRRRGLIVAGSAALALAAVATGGIWLASRGKRPAAPPVVRAYLLPPAGQTFDTVGDYSGTIEVSPDGARVAFLAADAEDMTRIWVRAIDGVEARALPGTEGAGYPFWSPDSSALGFFANGKLRRVELAGGAATVLADAHDGRGGAWSAGGDILFTPDWRAGLLRVSAGGGAVTPATTIDDKLHTTHRWPIFLPDRRRFLFLAANHDASLKANDGIYLASLDGGAPVRVVASKSQPALSAGHLLHVRADGALVAQPFDVERARLTGAARVLAEGVRYDGGSYYAVFSAGGDVLAYQTGGSGATQSRLVWCDRAGNELSEVGARNLYFSPALSPDGRRVAVKVGDPSDLWIFDVARAVGTRFTFTPVANEWGPVWSPDGSALAYALETLEQGSTLPRWQVVIRRVDGGEETIVPTPTGGDKLPTDWSPDGRTLLVTGQSPATAEDVWMVSARGDPGAGGPLLGSTFAEAGATLSKDGRWVAYVSDEAGRPDVYVTQFPHPGGKWRISSAGGASPRWRADGREIFYVTPRSKLMAVAIGATAGGLEVGAAQPLAPALTLRRDESPSYDVTADGQRFVINVSDEAERAAPVTLLVGWPATLTP